MKAAFEAKTFAEGKLVLAYTYAATDAKAGAIGKLPTEIADNDDVYVIPFTRVVVIHRVNARKPIISQYLIKL